MENELMPCPFCGCHVIKFTTDPVHYHRHTIKCEDCPGRAEFFSSTREQAVAAWNRRAQLASAPKINAEFEVVSNGWTGTTEAKVKRVETQDDGSLTVVIDHWPAPATSASSSDCETCCGAGIFIKKRRSGERVESVCASCDGTGAARPAAAHASAPSSEAAVRLILESHAVYLSANTIKQIVNAVHSVASMASASSGEAMDIKPEDIRVETYSPVGYRQWVSHADRGVRITHLPTGITVACHTERNQHRNKVMAMEELRKAVAAAPASAQQGEWDGDDFDALRHLSANFTDTAGVIQPKPGYSPTSKDYAALDYLCNEWDYAYATTPKADPQQGEDEPPLPKALGEVEAWVTRDYGRKTSSETLEPYDEYCTIEQAKEYGDAREAHAVAHMMRKLGDGVSADDDERLTDLILAWGAAAPGEAAFKAYSNVTAYIDAKLAQARATTTVPASENIDTPEFRKLTFTYAEALHHDTAPATQAAFATLIAHINAWHAAGVEKARAVPEGWKLVPVEATHEMKAAMLTLFGLGLTSANESRIKRSWHKALAAAPSPAAETNQTKDKP